VVSPGTLAFVPLAIAAWVLAGSAWIILERAVTAGSLDAALKRLAGLPRSTWGMAVAHGGVAIAAIGIAASVTWSEENVVLLKPGQSAAVGGFEVRLLSVTDEAGPNYTSKFARLDVLLDGHSIDTLVAERRTYPHPGSETTEAGMRARPMGVLYVTIGQPRQNGSWVVRLYYHPLILLIWWGAGVMVLGGVLSLSDRRLRIGAPKAAEKAAMAAAE
jgi:cytochrome c-type biogenesis protein CcmF